jgi:hypothetical protein
MNNLIVDSRATWAALRVSESTIRDQSLEALSQRSDSKSPTLRGMRTRLSAAESRAIHHVEQRHGRRTAIVGLGLLGSSYPNSDWLPSKNAISSTMATSVALAQ